jgi:hypothetical protein
MPEQTPAKGAPAPQETYTLTQEQLQKVLNYLVSKPYVEIFQLVEMIRTIQPNQGATIHKLEAVPVAQASDAQSGQ